MNRRSIMVVVLALTLCFTASVFAVPSYRSFIEWNGPYFHVRHALNPDSSAYLDYLVNSPPPLSGSPFSSPTAIALYENSGSTRAIVADHDHHRVQTFNANALWKVETLTYSSTILQGNFSGQTIKFLLGYVIPGSEQIDINGKSFTRVNSLTGYTATDSVYVMTYDGPPSTGGVATLPTGWFLSSSDSVRVEYAYAWPAGATPGVNDIDYVLTQTVPTDLPLQLDQEDFADDPDMSDLTSIAVNTRTGGGLMDLYLVNGLANGNGSLASYALSSFGIGGAFSYIDTYPGPMARPYDVEIVEQDVNTAGTITVDAVGTTGVTPTRLVLAPITNQNTFLGHDYRLTYSFDTSSTMNQGASPDNLESDMVYDPITGKLHMVFSKDAEGVRYVYSYDYGKSWSTPVLIPAPASGLAGAVGSPRIVVRTTGQIHIVYEAQDAAVHYELYHSMSSDGITWSTSIDLTSPIPAVNCRYPNLLIEPGTDKLHLIFAGDGDVWEEVYDASWTAALPVVSVGAGAAFSAPHAVMSDLGRIYCAYASEANEIGYIFYNGTAWGSYFGGGVFMPGVPDRVTTGGGAHAGFAAVSGTNKQTYPCPQVVLDGDTLWVFWAGNGADDYLGGGATHAQIYYNQLVGLTNAFTPGSGTAITPATDDVAPMNFTATADVDGNIYVVYPFAATTADAEGLRYKVRMKTTGWFPAEANIGRNIYLEGGDVSTFAAEPRLIAPSIAGQFVPMLSCGKGYAAAGFGTRILYKIIDGVLTILDETDQAEVNQFRVWTHGSADAAAIPGLLFAISNLDELISNTDDGGGANEFGVGDYFELNGTPAAKNDLLFVSDCDNHRVKVIRPYDNIDGCFGGTERWDVPGYSDGSPGQSFKLATTGGENSFTVWASPDSTPWTIVNDLLIAGPLDRKCELNRYTHEISFGDNIHGLIPPAGTFIRVRYDESVDEAEFGALGSGSGQMNHPHGLAVRYNSMLGQYDLYLCDTDNNRLAKFAYKPDQAVNPNLWASPVVSWNKASADTDLIDNPEDVEVLVWNNAVYLVVSDRDQARLLIYKDNEATGLGGNTAPAYVSTVGGHGNSVNGFLDPRGLAVMAEDSGIVVMATDADRNQVSKILRRDWLASSTDQGQQGGNTGSNVLLINNIDALDNDAYLLLQPGSVRTVELRLGRADSLVALRASGVFPPGIIDILSINEGNLWSGESYTNKIFLFDFDNTTGHFEVNTSMVGDVNGLTSTDTRVIASIVVRADSGMVIPSSGEMAYVDSTTELRKANNLRVFPFNRNNLNLRGSYLADIAKSGGSPGTAPSMIPEPDGAINFADVNVFTQGWNGNGVVFDPIADIGPFSGTIIPRLVANPDGKLDAFDLLSLSTMYNWFNSAGPLVMMPPPPGNESTLDETRPVVAVERQTEHGWTVEIQVRDVGNLTTAHLFLEVQNAGGSVYAVHEGGFLKSEANTIFLDRVQDNLADLSIGRLCREHPAISGSGTLASFDLSLPPNQTPKIRLVYELRDNGNNVLSTAELTNLAPEPIPTEFSLSNVYPNPFNSTTTFTMNLPEAASVSLRVFNVLGQEIVQVAKRDLPAGVHRMVWEARDNNGAPLPTGLYFARLESAGKLDVVKLMLLR